MISITSTSVTRNLFIHCLAVICIYSSLVQSNPTKVPCIQECNSTSICQDGQCILSCEADCTSDLEEVCGSDSVTYSSRCELEKHNCQNDLSLTVKHMGTCHSCKRKREENNQLKASTTGYASHLRQIVDLLSECEEYMSMGFSKTSNIPYPFQPECSEDDSNDYALYQYNQFCDMYWCSTPEGKLIEGTYQLDKDQVNCEKALANLHSCTYDDKTYHDGEEIDLHPKGACICSNGTIICPRNYDFPSGQWPEESLVELKGDIVQMFYQQHQHDAHYEIVLNHIVNNVADISSDELSKILEWKFNYYDDNNNGIIESIEASRFIGEVYNLIKLKTFREQLENAIDVDSNTKFSQHEWSSFFKLTVDSTNTSVTRRSAIKRQLRTTKRKSH